LTDGVSANPPWGAVQNIVTTTWLNPSSVAIQTEYCSKTTMQPDMILGKKYSSLTNTALNMSETARFERIKVL